MSRHGAFLIAALGAVTLFLWAEPRVWDWFSDPDILLYQAIIENDPDAALRLLVRQPDLASKPLGPTGRFPFWEAAMFQNREVFDLLYAWEPDLDARDERGQTALHFAALRGEIPLARILLERGADPNSHNTQGRTPLDTALENMTFETWFRNSGVAEVAEILLAAGGAPAGEPKIGNAALHWAAMNGNENLARFLLDHGADRGIKDEVGRTPLEMALESGQEGVARIIHERTD